MVQRMVGICAVLLTGMSSLAFSEGFPLTCTAFDQNSKQLETPVESGTIDLEGKYAYYKDGPLVEISAVQSVLEEDGSFWFFKIRDKRSGKHAEVGINLTELGGKLILELAGLEEPTTKLILKCVNPLTWP